MVESGRGTLVLAYNPTTEDRHPLQLVRTPTPPLGTAFSSQMCKNIKQPLKWPLINPDRPNQIQFLVARSNLAALLVFCCTDSSADCTIYRLPSFASCVRLVHRENIPALPASDWPVAISTDNGATWTLGYNVETESGGVKELPRLHGNSVGLTVGVTVGVTKGGAGGYGLQGHEYSYPACVPWPATASEEGVSVSWTWHRQRPVYLSLSLAQLKELSKPIHF
eukprot:1179801-Prorocentrum_minimum.AAC.2